mgnify:CR=1 FL=1
MALKVLIVDDEALARSRLRTLLGDCTDPRAEVVGEAGNAVAAMEQIQRAPCDLVLLDIHMPGVDGMALAAQHFHRLGQRAHHTIDLRMPGIRNNQNPHLPLPAPVNPRVLPGSDNIAIR